ncbi:hypothetical protein [Calditerrivibrio nitroreducens]|uniref:Uncharacterized protein n=1 Tax=Calditerrivibrio nitroreducens (strain DSM 19672 / NBRC 101217 / Yu37-1) TaxID=768670 RepID=E4TGH7_CALNY|nr:hypothetical protein [Calditerrivibrio nitroreducens]ADR18658.1 hypothetical protein Calni_0747 [Calditerrivibrio nitroreducens DSM 19672]
MNRNIKPSCSICAWRGTCNKKFSIKDPSKCIDFSLDVTIDLPEDEDDDKKEKDKSEK